MLNNEMTKAEAMDKRVDAHETGITSSDVFAIIHEIFQLDVESVPELPTSPKAALDAYLASCGNKPTGADIRILLNQTLGINLDGLSALDAARFSLYSKGQWMIQHDNDLFVVHTGTGDVDVRIQPTLYFCEHTGSDKLPAELINELLPLGFDFEEASGSCYYANPTGEAVSDAFKGQTIMAIRKVIMRSYTHL